MAGAKYTVAIIKDAEAITGTPKFFEQFYIDLEEIGLKIDLCIPGIFYENVWEEIYEGHKDKSFFKHLISTMSSKSVRIFKLVPIREGVDPVTAWRDYIGPTDPEEAKKLAPESFRARYGTDLTNNAAHGSDSWLSAQKEWTIFRYFAW